MNPSMILEVAGHHSGDRKKRERYLTKWNLTEDWNADAINAEATWDTSSWMDRRKTRSRAHFWRQALHQILVVNEKMRDCRDSVSMVLVFDYERKSNDFVHFSVKATQSKSCTTNYLFLGLAVLSNLL